MEWQTFPTFNGLWEKIRSCLGLNYLMKQLGKLHVFPVLYPCYSHPPIWLDAHRCTDQLFPASPSQSYGDTPVSPLERMGLLNLYISSVYSAPLLKWWTYSDFSPLGTLAQAVIVGLQGTGQASLHLHVCPVSSTRNPAHWLEVPVSRKRKRGLLQPLNGRVWKTI